jgi:hypothetical protein
VSQSFDETAKWDGAVRNELKEILVLINRGADTTNNTIGHTFSMICIPAINLMEEISIKRPSLPWG